MRKTILALVFVACGGAAVVRTPTPSAPMTIASATPSATAVVSTSIDASAPLVDLLWNTNVLVAVSSRVDNDTDRPEHLVDHKPETAWNGKTGNLVGAWIRFRVPDDASVDHALLTVGFDKSTAKGEDLFLQNHRITKVRVWHAGKALREVTLDPNDRKPQKVAIGTSGGDFQIEVVEVTPGTKTNWKEIAVSEFAVMGTPGAQRKDKPSAPGSVWVGQLGMKELAYEESTGATYLAACLAWTREHDAIARKVQQQLVANSLPDSNSTCAGPKKTTPGKGVLLEYARMSEVEGPSGPYGIHFTGDVLALKTATGVTLTNIRLSGREAAIYWSVAYKLLSESWDGDRLVFDVEHYRVTDSDGAGTPEELHSEEKTVYRTTCEAAKCITVETSKVSVKP